MILLTFTVDNINTVIQIYNQILIERGTSESGPFTTVTGVGPVYLAAGQTIYTENDLTGTATDWYISRYYSSTTGALSDWSDPVLGEPGDIYYNPLFPAEVSYGTQDQLIIDRIRIYIGDPVGLRREYGEEAASSIHPDGKTYEMDNKGWPADVHMNNVAYNTSADPTVNGYRYLRFSDFIDVTVTETIVSGCETRTLTHGVDIWYYTFRHSDREIMEAYNTCPPPPGLTTATATSEHYMLQTAIDLLMQENWEDVIEDGARIRDEGSSYDPSPGLRMRDDLIDKLQKRLDDAIKASILSGIEGVLID
jgi:hypothetical protein